MVWKYQNEIAPIFYYGISTKTNEKDLKIPILQPPDWKHPYWMSLYYNISLYLYQNTNIIVMAYFRYNILISQYEYWKDQIKSHKFQIIQKFQLPNISGNCVLFLISNVSDVSFITHFKI